MGGGKKKVNDLRFLMLNSLQHTIHIHEVICEVNIEYYCHHYCPACMRSRHISLSLVIVAIERLPGSVKISWGEIRSHTSTVHQLYAVNETLLIKCTANEKIVCIIHNFKHVISLNVTTKLRLVLEWLWMLPAWMHDGSPQTPHAWFVWNTRRWLENFAPAGLVSDDDESV